MDTTPTVRRLLDRGVILPCPGGVEMDESVSPERIASGVILHTGTQLRGKTTSIGPGSEIGAEAPATVEDCQLGRGVSLKGGYFSGATFLDGANMGSGAHVRPGTLLEEEAGGAHAAGFKQTILFPFVTAGSLINFCDVLMAGGTSRKDHSEIGSSYIHFNFTPHQDKATPSLIGDVPRGVMLDQAPIFLGGQGGLVGPVRIAYGAVIPAGMICRRDILEERQLYVAGPLPSAAPRRFAAGIYRAIQRIVHNNLLYIGNLWALKAWYEQVRTRTMSGDPFAEACRVGALRRLDEGLAERLKRLGELAEKMKYSLEQARAVTGEDLPPAARVQQTALRDRWPAIEAGLKAGPPVQLGEPAREDFLAAWKRVPGDSGHVRAVQSLDAEARRAGTAWLQAIVDYAAGLWTPV